TSSSGCGVWPAPVAFDFGSDVLAWNPGHLRLAAELQHGNAIRHPRCTGQCMEPPGGNDHADRGCSRPSRRDLKLCDAQAVLETFASQPAWTIPDLYWLSITTLINWVANVILPVYAASQVAAMALRLGVFSLVHPTSGWLRHCLAAALCLMVSGVLRLAEFF